MNEGLKFFIAVISVIGIFVFIAYSIIRYEKNHPCLEYQIITKTRTVYKTAHTNGFTSNGDFVFGTTQVPVGEEKYQDKQCIRRK